MNDLLKALHKEQGTLSDRIYIIELYLQKDKSEYITTTPYTINDLIDCKNRLQEINVAIIAIKNYRKNPIF